MRQCVRDEFSQRTKSRLAKEAGYVCSFPLCRLATRFYVEKNGKLIQRNIGEAAHITAASPKGPRFDATLSHDRRKSHHNGIWMCRNHAHYIDIVPDAVSVELLKEWKAKHNKDVATGIVQMAGKAYVDRLWQVMRIILQGIGPFVDRTSVSLKKFNILCGPEGSGKSLLCQCVCAFASPSFYKLLRKRFISRNKNAQVLLGIDFGIPNATSQEIYEWSRDRNRLRLSPTSAISHALALQNSLNAIIIDYSSMCSGKVKMASAMSEMAKMLDLTLDQIWSSIEKMSGIKTSLNISINRDGLSDAKVSINNGPTLPFNSLSGGERALVLVDMALRCVYAAPADQQWLIVIENTTLYPLDRVFRKRVFDALYMTPLNVQVIVCVNDLSAVDRFIGDHKREFDRELCDRVSVLTTDADPYKYEKIIEGMAVRPKHDNNSTKEKNHGI